MQVRTIVFDEIQQVATAQDKRLAPLTDDLLLLESALNSLCVAILVANLEDRLGIDPFGTGEDTAIPVTLGEFVQLYENAIADT